MEGSVFFITGIDTDIGKTICTGLLARYLSDNKCSVITQKLVQTGCKKLSEDILLHRKMMGIEPLEVDLKGLTCRYVFNKPCSPHLAAEIENRVIDCDLIETDSENLLKNYNYLLLEGAGGLCTPITRDISSLDYVQDNHYPLIVVTSSRLGSLNHTLSLVELCSVRNITIAGILYNRFAEQDAEIGADSKQVIEEGLQKFGYSCPVIEIWDKNKAIEYDFSKIFKI